MFERLTNDDIGGALTEVIALLGVKEAIPCHDLVALLRKRETQDCVQRLATRFGMPITVDLSGQDRPTDSVQAPWHKPTGLVEVFKASPLRW
jgi:hypothetical protein